MQALLPRVFNATVDFFNMKVLLVKPPDVDQKAYTWYPIRDIVAAWDNLIGAAAKLKDQSGYR